MKNNINYFKAKNRYKKGKEYVCFFKTNVPPEEFDFIDDGIKELSDRKIKELYDRFKLNFKLSDIEQVSDHVWVKYDITTFKLTFKVIK